MSTGRRGVGPDYGRGLILPDEVAYQTFNTRIDYDKIEQLIDSRMGYDLFWGRALKCPCRVATQTDQPDPTCVVCRGDGWRYVHPFPEDFPEYCGADGTLGDYDGMPIRGLIPEMSLDFAAQDQAGVWYKAGGTVTVKGQVRLGHWDRLIMKDSELFFDQTITAPGLGGTVTIGRNTETQIRYPLVDVLALHTLTTRYRLRTDFSLDDAGQLVFVAGRGPAAGEKFSLKYSFHPIWIVTGFPRAVSGSRRRQRDSGDWGEEYEPLPQTASIMLDFVTP